MSILQLSTSTSLSNSTILLFTISDLGKISYLSTQLGVLAFSVVLFIILMGGILSYAIYLLKKGETLVKTNSNSRRVSISLSNGGLFNRNRWVMIGLSLLMLGFRTVGMIFCIVSKSLVTIMRGKMEDYVTTNYQVTSQEYRDFFVYENSTITGQQAGVESYYRELDQAFYSLEIFFSTNTVTILIIAMCFIGNIFLKTVILAKGENQSKGSKVLLYIFNVLSGFFGISFFIMVIVLSVMSPLFWLKIVKRDAGNAVFIVMAALFVSQLLLQSIFSIVS